MARKGRRKRLSKIALPNVGQVKVSVVQTACDFADPVAATVSPGSGCQCISCNACIHRKVGLIFVAMYTCISCNRLIEHSLLSNHNDIVYTSALHKDLQP